jgi:hypothetical protein
MISMKCNEGSFYKYLLAYLNTLENTRSSIWNIFDVQDKEMMIFTLLLKSSWTISGFKWADNWPLEEL